MPATVTKMPSLMLHAFSKVHDFGSDTLQFALSNTAPASESIDPTTEGNGVLANVTQIAYTNYTDNMTVDRVLEGVTSDVSLAGEYTLDANDVLITASGGALASFRYIYIFNQSAANDELIALIDAGEVITLADGQPQNLKFSTNGILQVS